MKVHGASTTLMTNVQTVEHGELTEQRVKSLLNGQFYLGWKGVKELLNKWLLPRHWNWCKNVRVYVSKETMATQRHFRGRCEFVTMSRQIWVMAHYYN